MSFKCKDCDQEYEFEIVLCQALRHDSQLGDYTCYGVVEEVLPCEYCKKMKCICDKAHEDRVDYE